MAHRFLEDIALADIAFEASGATLEEMFISAAEAVTEVMVNPKDVKPKKTEKIDLSETSVDRLLYDWLSELIYLKDAEGLLFSKFDIKIHEDHKGYSVKGSASGEKINRKRHKLVTDVKAVTMHMFEVKKEKKMWKSTVVLDI